MTPDDAALAMALRDLSGDLAWPDAGAPGRDVASRVRAAIVAAPPVARPTRRALGWRRWRRPLILALAALLVLAAIAGAWPARRGPGWAWAA
jgi:hypothetical protein